MSLRTGRALRSHASRASAYVAHRHRKGFVSLSWHGRTSRKPLGAAFHMPLFMDGMTTATAPQSRYPDKTAPAKTLIEKARSVEPEYSGA